MAFFGKKNKKEAAPPKFAQAQQPDSSGLEVKEESSLLHKEEVEPAPIIEKKGMPAFVDTPVSEQAEVPETELENMDIDNEEEVPQETVASEGGEQSYVEVPIPLTQESVYRLIYENNRLLKQLYSIIQQEVKE